MKRKFQVPSKYENWQEDQPKYGTFYLFCDLAAM